LVKTLNIIALGQNFKTLYPLVKTLKHYIPK
jgi:hypothetical protein